MFIFTPNQDLPSALTRARCDVEAWYMARGEDPLARRVEWAGHHLNEMMRNRETTIRLLEFPAANVRLTAVSLVAEYWHPNEVFVAGMLRLAFEDPESRVRGAALVALWRLKHYIRDPTRFLGALFGELFPVRRESVAGVSHRANETMAHVHRGLKEYCEDLAGPLATQMVTSREGARSNLSHPEPKVRCAALMLLKNYWGPTEDFPLLCEKMISEDPDVGVRSLAIACLAGCYKGTDDKRIGLLAARLVCDDSSRRGVRVAAYRALFAIRGIPFSAFPEAFLTGFRFPEDVQWDFVKSFLQ